MCYSWSGIRDDLARSATTLQCQRDYHAMRTAEAFAEMCRLPLQSGTDTRDVLARAALLVEMLIGALTRAVEWRRKHGGLTRAEAVDTAMDLLWSGLAATASYRTEPEATADPRPGNGS